MRAENIIASFALLALVIVVVWDALVYFGVPIGHTITDEIRGDWRSWLFFVLVGLIAGAHFLRGR